MIWRTRSRSFDLSSHALIMGIVNVTPDSFSDGGLHATTDAAVTHALRLADEGADIIDIGGESTRPGAAPVSSADEIARVIPVLKALRPLTSAALSIDTMKADVAAAAIAAGADIINDVSGLSFDPLMAATAAASNAGLVLMHMQGTPRTMQLRPGYADTIAEISAALRLAINLATAAGVHPDAIALDPGIGFGKRLEDNLAILRQPDAFSLDGRPVLLGVSRKSFIGQLTDSSSPASRDWPTVALTSLARERGARILRVHDVRPNVQALRMTEAILNAS
ncbi:MAG: dihydropteroate synthase [Verrucomicrobia bacterium]|jgi:dihydropteroate synthase|nr:MAG: dihydropteroate synthase [Verrucomicrobiota bacterium]